MSEKDEVRAPDRAPGAPHPRETFDLLGHEEAEADLASALSFDRLHHAWLITGPKGTGKATLAYRAARVLLGAKRKPGGRPLDVDPEDPVARKIAADAHTDLRVLRRSVDDKGKLRAEIVVDDARALPDFFSMSAGDGGRRVAIVDSADDLNRNAANALLKTIEEPPPGGIILLVCHAPGSIPRTILSRCRRLGLRTPPQEAVTNWLIAHEINADVAALATRLARGAPGLAFSLAKSGGAERYQRVAEALMLAGSPRGAAAAQALIDDSSARDGLALDALLDFAQDWLARAGRLSAGGKAEEMVEGEADAMRRFAEDVRPVAIAQAHSAFSALRASADELNYDKAHTAIEAFRIVDGIKAPRRGAA